MIISKNRPQHLFFSFISLIFIYFVEYETIVRSSAWSFGHSDPDPSSVLCLGRKTKIQIFTTSCRIFTIIQTSFWIKDSFIMVQFLAKSLRIKNWTLLSIFAKDWAIILWSCYLVWTLTSLINVYCDKVYSF